MTDQDFLQDSAQRHKEIADRVAAQVFAFARRSGCNESKALRVAELAREQLPIGSRALLDQLNAMQAQQLAEQQPTLSIELQFELWWKRANGWEEPMAAQQKADEMRAEGASEKEVMMAMFPYRHDLMTRGRPSLSDQVDYANRMWEMYQVCSHVAEVQATAALTVSPDSVAPGEGAVSKSGWGSVASEGGPSPGQSAGGRCNAADDSNIPGDPPASQTLGQQQADQPAARARVKGIWANRADFVEGIASIIVALEKQRRGASIKNIAKTIDRSERQLRRWFQNDFHFETWPQVVAAAREFTANVRLMSDSRDGSSGMSA